MKLLRLQDAPAYDPHQIVVVPFLDGVQSNVRVIRLSPGQALPPHTHGHSDLMLFVVEGVGFLETVGGPVAFDAGALAFYPSNEELRVLKTGQARMTLLAFLAPPFPPREHPRPASTPDPSPRGST